MRKELVELKKYIDEWYQEPKEIPPSRKRVARNRWLIMSWQRWAAEEFLLYLKKSKSDDLVYEAEQFTSMMDNFACKETPNKQMFSIAYDVAADLTEHLYL